MANVAAQPVSAISSQYYKHLDFNIHNQLPVSDARQRNRQLRRSAPSIIQIAL
jgi:hypothetical protein